MSASLLVTCASCGRRNRLQPENLSVAGQCGECGTELPPLGAPVEIDTAEALNDVIARSRVPVLVDFWAPWCGPCRALAPEILRVAAHQAGRLLVVKTNTDADPVTGQLHHVLSIPLLALFVGGHEVGRHTGAMPAPQIEAWLGELARGAGAHVR